jgi:enolase|uniref:Enolase n=1 Tax=candidate division WOR-3 bacterium TaxID=2052148 RepID=A0A7C3YQB4_UNCW3
MRYNGSLIEEIRGREILDSRGDPTLEVEVITKSGDRGICQVPAGKSKGKKEVEEIRDGDERYQGKGVRKAVELLRKAKEKLCGLSVLEQPLIDSTLRSIFGSSGGNITTGVSIACCKAAANFLSIPLYLYLGGNLGKFLPIPQFNLINGGKHAPNNLSIQEFLVMPIGAQTFSDALRFGVEVYKALERILAKKGLLTGVGDEGGFSPNLKDNESALNLLFQAIEAANYEPGIDLFFALDCAASEFYDEKENLYHLKPEGKRLTSEELIGLYEDWVKKYPLISIEDGLSEKDWAGWKVLTDKLGKKIQLVGDDIFVTSPSLLTKGIKEGIANAVLVKVNQVGTLTEALECISLAQRSRYAPVISHRSGETEDTFISHLAFATNSYQIKSGAPCRGERVCKYNELLRIEEETKAKYAGSFFFTLYGQRFSRPGSNV